MDGLSSFSNLKRPRRESVEFSSQSRRVRQNDALPIPSLRNDSTASSRQSSQGPLDGNLEDTHVYIGEDVRIEELALASDSTRYFNDTRSVSDSTSLQSFNVDYEVSVELPLPPREICYGMICGGKAAFIEGFSLKKECYEELSKLKASSEQFLFVRRQNYYILHSDRHDSDFAVLNKQTSTILDEISKIANLKFHAFIGHHAPADSRQKGMYASYSVILSVSINVYGPFSLAKPVGRILSRAGVYLQHPLYLGSKEEYDNPHYFKRLHEHKPFSAVGALVSVPKIVVHSVPKAKQIFDSVVQDLQLVDLLQPITVDPRITTSLLDHQKQAIQFILQREKEMVTGHLSLWRPYDAGSKIFYQHIICGSREEKHPGDVLGGIIADEMGLGKTLSMISAVITSLENAALYATVQDTTDSLEKLRKSKTTLVIAPSVVLLHGWAAEVERHLTKGSLKLYQYHGSRRETDPEKLQDYDVILTTYSTVTAESFRKNSTLQKIAWFRIVLDEAHEIRHQSTKQFHAVSSLTARSRWCLSGTPIQNHMDDLGSLVKFLRVPHFDHRREFQRHVVAPLASGKQNSTHNLRLLLKSICLRRTQSLLHIPEATYVVEPLVLSLQERRLYDEILKVSSQEIDHAISNKSTAKAHTSIMQTILKLRMLCVHGISRQLLTEGRSDIPIDIDEALDLLQEGEDFGQELPFNLGAPLVEQPNQSVIQSSFPPLVSEQGIQSHSTKLLTLLKNLQENASKGKSIVFSCWKTSLDLAEPLLKAGGIKFVRIDGSVQSYERATIISRFISDDTITVILMTTGTGSVGLNLTIATQVHLLEPQWNPSIESQAIGRVLRLTQKKAVTVIRYIVRDTVEETVQERQNKKLELAELSLEEERGTTEQTLKRLNTLRSLLY